MKNKIILTTLAPKTHRTSEENLGILYLKSSLNDKGYNVTVIDGWLNELSVDEVYERIIKEEDILYVGISSYMSNTEPTIKLINMLKSHDKDIKIICGGFGPTFYPDDYLNANADIVARGEGEETLVELADALSKNESIENIENISYKKEGNIYHNPSKRLLDNLDELPFPSREMIPVLKKKKSTVNMVTSRGCSGNCEFCSVISFFRLSKGKVWRTRSIKNIVDEIEELYDKGITYIKMVDDSFIDGTRDEKWANDFANEIEKRDIKVKLRGQIRADKVTDNILYDLKRAGFFSFACGIENGSPIALKRMNKTATLEDNERALELFKKYNYLVQMGFILFDRDTTIKELEDNYSFLNKYDFTVTKGIFSEMYSAEGTKLNSRLRSDGTLLESNFVDNNNKYTINNENVRKIYSALKRWHKAHSEIYDMAVDPLNAPKAISDREMDYFYQEVMKLKKQDLLFFREVLDIVKTDKTMLDSYVEEKLRNDESFYNNINQKVLKLYKTSGLEYHASKNPFI